MPALCFPVMGLNSTLLFLPEGDSLDNLASLLFSVSRLSQHHFSVFISKPTPFS